MNKPTNHPKFIQEMLQPTKSSVDALYDPRKNRFLGRLLGVMMVMSTLAIGTNTLNDNQAEAVADEIHTESPENTITIEIEETDNDQYFMNQEQLKRVGDKLKADGMLELVEESKNVYDEASKQTGLDWKIFATLHYREASLDSNKSILAGEELGSTNPDHNKIFPAERVANMVAGGNHLLQSLEYWYPHVDPFNTSKINDYADLYGTYNRGHMYKTAGADWKLNPYVYNYYFSDEPMRWPIDSSIEIANPGKPNYSVGAIPFHGFLADFYGEPLTFQID